jgi:hypothetical protein
LRGCTRRESSQRDDSNESSPGIFRVYWPEICGKARLMELLACGNPFRNIGPIGWLVIAAVFVALVVGCILAVVNPVLAATMKIPSQRKRLHLGLVATYVAPGLVLALLALTASDFASGFPVWGLLVYFVALPLWTGVHFAVLLSIRRELRQAGQNIPPTPE